VKSSFFPYGLNTDEILPVTPHFFGTLFKQIIAQIKHFATFGNFAVFD